MNLAAGDILLMGFQWGVLPLMGLVLFLLAFHPTQAPTKRALSSRLARRIQQLPLFLISLAVGAVAFFWPPAQPTVEVLIVLKMLVTIPNMARWLFGHSALACTPPSS